MKRGMTVLRIASASVLNRVLRFIVSPQGRRSFFGGQSAPQLCAFPRGSQRPITTGSYHDHLRDSSPAIEARAHRAAMAPSPGGCAAWLPWQGNGIGLEVAGVLAFQFILIG